MFFVRFAFGFFIVVDSSITVMLLGWFLKNSSHAFNPFLVDNGSTYALKVDAFLEEKTFYLTKGLVPYFMEKNRSIDIDDLDDFKLLEKIMDGYKKQ